MKKLILIIGFLIGALGLFAQSNVSSFRVPTATYAFISNMPIGTTVYNVATGTEYTVISPVLVGETLTTASAKFTAAAGVSVHSALTNLDYASAGHTGFEPAKGTDDNFVTDAEKVVLGNTSNINTGDQVLPTTGVDFDAVGTDNSDNNAINTLYSSLVSFPEAPNNGSEYVRKNEAWAVATSGGGAVTDLSFSGTDSIITLESSTGDSVIFEEGVNIKLTATSTSITIQSNDSLQALDSVGITAIDVDYNEGNHIALTPYEFIDITIRNLPDFGKGAVYGLIEAEGYYYLQSDSTTTTYINDVTTELAINQIIVGEYQRVDSILFVRLLTFEED